MCCWSSVVVVLVFGMKIRKRGTEFGAILDLVHKETVLEILGHFSTLYSLYTQVIYTKVIFQRAWFWSFWNVVIVSLVFLPHNCVPYCKCDSNSKWYAVFNIWKFALIQSLLSMPIAWFSLFFICATCLFQSRYSSVKTPRYLAEWVGTIPLPSNLNHPILNVDCKCRFQFFRAVYL